MSCTTGAPFCVGFAFADINIQRDLGRPNPERESVYLGPQVIGRQVTVDVQGQLRVRVPHDALNGSRVRTAHRQQTGSCVSTMPTAA